MEKSPDPPPPFALIAESLRAPLLRYLVRFVGDRTLAEDLLQETLLRVSSALPGFEGRSRLETWAFAIATRVAADHFRHPANRISIVDVDELNELPGVEPSIEHNLVIDEMSSCVRGVIDSLPEDYRAALVLHDLEGLTAAQTAEISGCALPTAKIRIHRARARLAEALRRECEFYRDGDDVFRCDRKPEPVSLDPRDRR